MQYIYTHTHIKPWAISRNMKGIQDDCVEMPAYTVRFLNDYDLHGRALAEKVDFSK